MSIDFFIFHIVFFINMNEFIDGLTSKAAQKVVWTLSLLEELETLPAAYFKKLVNTDDIWEVRVSLGSDACA